jgi:hypothetical protein
MTGLKLASEILASGGGVAEYLHLEHACAGVNTACDELRQILANCHGLAPRDYDRAVILTRTIRAEARKLAQNPRSGCVAGATEVVSTPASAGKRF